MCTFMLLAAATACDQDAHEKHRAPATESTRARPSLYEARPFQAATAALIERAGSSGRALSLLVYPEHMVLQAHDARNPARVEQYVYRDGTVSGPVPVTLLGRGKLEDNLFPVDAARLEAVPELVAEARDRAGIPEGRVARVLLKRNLPQSMDIQFRVFITSERRDAHVDADKDGNIVAVSR